MFKIRDYSAKIHWIDKDKTRHQMHQRKSAFIHSESLKRNETLRCNVFIKFWSLIYLPSSTGKMFFFIVHNITHAGITREEKIDCRMVAPNQVAIFTQTCTKRWIFLLLKHFLIKKNIILRVCSIQ